MKFESANPWAVRSIKQRQLLNTWVSAYKDRNGVPALDDFAPAGFDEEKPDIAYFTVMEGNPPRIRIDNDGKRLESAFGGSARGKFLDEYIDPKLHGVTMPVYHECIRRCLPVFTVSEVMDTAGRTVTQERLLLPFANQNKIDRLLVSMKPISEAGRFEIRNLMSTKRTTPVIKLCAVIDKNLFRGSSRAGNDDDITF
jgi:hypothetical protein